MKQATAYEGISHFAAQIIDLALLAAIVKENRTSPRGLRKEFNMVQNTTAKQQFRHCRWTMIAGNRRTVGKRTSDVHLHPFWQTWGANNHYYLQWVSKLRTVCVPTSPKI